MDNVNNRDVQRTIEQQNPGKFIKVDRQKKKKIKVNKNNREWRYNYNELTKKINEQSEANCEAGSNQSAFHFPLLNTQPTRIFEPELHWPKLRPQQSHGQDELIPEYCYNFDYKEEVKKYDVRWADVVKQ